MEPTPRTFPVRPDAEHVLIDLAAMKAAVADRQVVKLDVRDVDEWIGESSSPYAKDYCPRKGRIPGAVWIEWYCMMNPTPTGRMFKSRDEILPNARPSGLRPTRRSSSTASRARASNAFVSLEEAGIRNVRIYFGSWNEWSRDPALPIDSGTPFAA